METKTYTQAQVDEIVESVKARQKEKFETKLEKSYVSLETYNEAMNKIKDFEFNNKKNDYKEVFKSNGGNLAAYDDFINNNKNLLELDKKDFEIEVNKIKETKKFYFENNNVDNTLMNHDENQEMGELLDNKEPAFSGTFGFNKRNF